MEQRKLGRSGLTVSAVGLGCMGMSEFYGTADEAESIATLHHALDQGINFLDTADMYGPFKNEELVGKAIRGRRDKVVLATKFGFVRNADASYVGVSGRPEYVRKACDASLQRLGVEYIDLYYQHRVDSQVPIEDTVGAMADLVQTGKIRFIGLSEAGVKTIRRANSIHPICALQSEYSLFTRDPEEEILPTLRELGIGFVPYSPLGRGILTGQLKKIDKLELNDFRRYCPRFQDKNFEKNVKLVEQVESLAQTKGVTSGQLALAWVLAQAPFIVPIPGTTRRKHLDENIAATQVKLTEQELTSLAEVMPKGAASGLRYPEVMMNMLNQ